MIAFEPVLAEHLPLVREWLGRPDVRRWWHDPDRSLGHVEDALAGRDATVYYLIVVGGRPVGLIQAYLVSDFPEWEEVVGPGQGLAGVDLLIGEEEDAGRGLGPQVLEQFAREIVFARPQTQALVATVEEANRRSWPRSRRPAFATCATSRRRASRTG